ncbi:ABC transporter ATP-binding protein [Falsiroseomonas sp. CW058]|uniref:ABC transporter ATP-binding protein n=1 Tax=Falsiroseomonas sp. CW058 TaxID=3388664 RepID=UPI003D31F1CF
MPVAQRQEQTTAGRQGLLVAERLTRAFGGPPVVDGVSFTLARGSITGLIGPNGAGKTTLFNLIAGSLAPGGGTLTLDGARIDGLRPDQVFARGLARTFQIPRPFPAMTVLENVMLAPPGQAGERFWTNWLRPAAVAAEERRNRDRAMLWLDFVGLAKLSAQPAGVLSGGQRKLLELARVLVAEPRLILLDEPGAGVSPPLLALIMEKIAELNARGTTFLVIEHNMDLVMTLCRPVLVLAQGRLLLEGSPEEVRRDPRVVEAYLG